ncbi:MAG: MFS transporter [Bacteroidales bacterium]
MNRNIREYKKYGTLFSLYIAQSIPMSFFSTVLPVIMRVENYSLQSIGLIQLMKIPWILKFLWAPLVDKKGETITHYKRWIFGSELFYAAVILSIGFFDFKTDFPTVIGLMLLAFAFSATQDIASDAFAIRILKKKERSMGNSMQSSGSFLGTLFGSGVLLVAYQYAGWQIVHTLLALFVILALLPLIFYREEHVRTATSIPVTFKDIGRFFKIPGILKRIILLVLYYSGIIGILAMLKPFLVDQGYSVAKIGFMAGIYGTGAGAASAFLAGFILKKAGNLKGLFIFSGLGIIASAYFVMLTYVPFSDILAYAGITLLWSAYGMASVVIYTISMNIVRDGREGTDYTIQIVLTHLSSLIIAVSSGKIADLLGYRGLFSIELVLGILAFTLIPFLYKDPELKNKTRSNNEDTEKTTGKI